MPRTILIVEDIDLCSETLEVALTQMPGIEARSVASAEEALRQLSAGGICALITDLHLPQMNGFELIAAIRANPVRADLPILVVSGDSDPATPTRLASLGADAYFPKPYSPAEVRGKLEQLLYVSPNRAS